MTSARFTAAFGTCVVVAAFTRPATAARLARIDGEVSFSTEAATYDCEP